MEYHPYVWMHDENDQQDAHVKDWRGVRARDKKYNAWMLALMSYESDLRSASGGGWRHVAELQNVTATQDTLRREHLMHSYANMQNALTVSPLSRGYVDMLTGEYFL